MDTKVKNSKPRMTNLEILRCLAMMMVVVLHYLDKGKLLPELTGAEMGGIGIAAWLLEAFCIVAVNVYMLISGYFLYTSSFKLSRLLQLFLQVWTYSVVIGLLAAFTGILPAAEVDTHYFLTLLFPISMGHYWFMTAYVFLYLLLPLIGAGVRKMSKEQMQLTLALLLIVFCLMKTVLPVRLEMDSRGMDCLWYVCVFVAAAYIRRFGVRFLESKAKAFGLYLIGCLGIVAECFVLRQIYLRTGSLDRILSISLEYNHLLTFLAAVGLFSFFLRLKLSGRLSGLLARLAPYTLGVYLLHENQGVRYAWENWLGADQISSIGGLLLGTILAAVSVFICGIIVEWLRSLLMRGIHFVLCKWSIYRRMVEKIDAVDGLFRISEKE
ncbi:MAG: acyltransferase [Lachnospiraceae bacterium]|nr:acyltransferase [Lachnospiraceae bacterium]